MTNTFFNLFVMAVFSGLVFACQPSSGVDEREVAQHLKKEREKVINKLEHLRRDIDEKINVVNDKINTSSDESVERYKEVNLELVNEREKVEALIDDVNHVGQRSWQDVKDGADYISIEVKRAIRKIDKEIEEIS